MTDDDRLSRAEQRLWKAFRHGFLESGDEWNKNTLDQNPKPVMRRLKARFEALLDGDRFELDERGTDDVDDTAPTPCCPVCKSEPGAADASLAPDQSDCPTRDCPINSWDSSRSVPNDAPGSYLPAGVLEADD